MAVVVRKDLKMGIGKLVSQACHACLEASELSKAKSPKLWRAWHEGGAKKVLLKVDSLEGLIRIEERAKRLKVPCALIRDRGLTQLPPETPTALGIGPALSVELDKVTGELKLL